MSISHLSLYRGKARSGLGESPGSVVGAGEQFLAADEGIFTPEICSESRPWLTFDASGQAAKDRVEGWSCFSAQGYLFVARLLPASVSFDARPTYFTHCRAFRLSADLAPQDPGALIGFSEAFDDPWAPEHRPAPREVPSAVSVRIPESTEEVESALRLLGHLYQALVTKHPVIVTQAHSELGSGNRMTRMVAFARAALPWRLKRDLRLRIYTVEPRLFLQQLNAHLLVVPESVAAQALEARRNAALLDAKCNVIRGPALSKEARAYADAVWARVERIPSGLLAFAARASDLLPAESLPTPAHLLAVQIAYNLASATPEKMDGLFTFLLKKLDAERESEVDVRALVRRGDINSLSSKGIEQCLMFGKDQETLGASVSTLLDLIADHARDTGVTLDEPMAAWDGLTRDRVLKWGWLLGRGLATVGSITKLGEKLDVFLSGLHSNPSAHRDVLLRTALLQVAARIDASTSPDRLLEALLHLSRSGGLPSDLRQRWMAGLPHVSSGDTRRAIVGRTADTELSCFGPGGELFIPESWDVDVAALVLGTPHLVPRISFDSVLRLARHLSVGTTPFAAFVALADVRMERDPEGTTDVLLDAGLWLVWRRAARSGGGAPLSPKRVAHAWFTAFRRRRLGAPRLEAWEQALSDLGDPLDEDDLSALIDPVSRKAAWPWIAPFQSEQLDGLAKRAADLPQLIRIEEAIDCEKDLGFQPDPERPLLADMLRESKLAGKIDPHVVDWLRRKPGSLQGHFPVKSKEELLFLLDHAGPYLAQAVDPTATLPTFFVPAAAEWLVRQPSLERVDPGFLNRLDACCGQAGSTDGVVVGEPRPDLAEWLRSRFPRLVPLVDPPRDRSLYTKLARLLCEAGPPSAAWETLQDEIRKWQRDGAARGDLHPVRQLATAVDGLATSENGGERPGLRRNGEAVFLEACSFYPDLLGMDVRPDRGLPAMAVLVSISSPEPANPGALACRLVLKRFSALSGQPADTWQKDRFLGSDTFWTALLTSIERPVRRARTAGYRPLAAFSEVSRISHKLSSPRVDAGGADKAPTAFDRAVHTWLEGALTRRKDVMGEYVTLFGAKSTQVFDATEGSGQSTLWYLSEPDDRAWDRSSEARARQLDAALKQRGGFEIHEREEGLRARISFNRQAGERSSYDPPERAYRLSVRRADGWIDIGKGGVAELALGDHLVVPVDREAERALDRFVHLLSGFPEETRRLLTGILRRPTLDREVEQLRRGIAASISGGEPPEKQARPKGRVSGFATKHVFLLIAVVAVSCLVLGVAGGVFVMKWLSWRAAPLAPTMPTTSAATPVLPPTATAAITVSATPVVTFDGLMENLHQTLKGTTDPNLKELAKLFNEKEWRKNPDAAYVLAVLYTTRTRAVGLEPPAYGNPRQHPGLAKELSKADPDRESLLRFAHCALPPKEPADPKMPKECDKNKGDEQAATRELRKVLDALAAGK